MLTEELYSPIVSSIRRIWLLNLKGQVLLVIETMKMENKIVSD